MKKLTLSSFAAGVMIGIAGIAYLRTNNPWVFSIGLLVICFLNLHLYTGKICYIDGSTFFHADLLVILLINLIAAGFLGIITHFVYPELVQKASELVATKINQGWRVFPRAIFCNVMIFIAVHSWRNLPSPNNIITLIFATSIFVICGFEHCIANAFYFSCAYEQLNENFIWYLCFNIFGNTIGGICAHDIAEYVNKQN